jgi:hypothetical protein
LLRAMLVVRHPPGYFAAGAENGGDFGQSNTPYAGGPPT